MSKQAMTVTELIEALQRQPAEAVVLVDVENYPWVTDVTHDARYSTPETRHVLLKVPSEATPNNDIDQRIRAAGPELLALVEFARDHIENATPQDTESERWVMEADVLIRHCRHGHAKWPAGARYIQ